MLCRLWRVLLAMALLGGVFGCSGHDSLQPSPGPATTGGRLPAVLAEVSLAPAGGDISLAGLDLETGQAVVVSGPALTLLDLATGMRRPLWTIPGSGPDAIAVAGGLAYVSYEDRQGALRLAAVELASGRLRADREASRSGGLLAGPNGRLYVHEGGVDTVEMRDGASLELMQTLTFAWGESPTLTLNAPRDRLYAVVGRQIRAFRAADLVPLWQVDVAGEGVQRLVVDDDSSRLYAVPAQWEGNPEASRLQVFSAESGQALPPITVQVPPQEWWTGEIGRTLPPTTPQAPNWDLVAADGQAGRLIFATDAFAATQLWQTDGKGRPTGTTTILTGGIWSCTGHGERIVAESAERHQVCLIDAATLETVSRITTSVEITDLVADPGHERVYVNDSAGTLHVLDARTNREQASLEDVGSGAMALDAANQLLFVGDSPFGFAPAVVDTTALTVTAVITGGGTVALDPAGHRAFVGAYPASIDEVQVWDTRTFRRLGAIASGGAPTYNPLRDEVYVLSSNRRIDIADGVSLALTGTLPVQLSPQPNPDVPVTCDDCPVVHGIAVDAAQEVIAVELAFGSARGSGAVPEPQFFSARTLAPITQTVNLFAGRDPQTPLIVPPDEGRIYVREREQHYGGLVDCLRTQVRQVDRGEALAPPLGLCPDLVLPGTGLALTLPRAGPAVTEGGVMVYDARTWEPLGAVPYLGNLEMDLAGERLYTWQGSSLTILSFSGGEPLPPKPAEPWPAGRPFGWVLEIHFSPDYARDRTIFVVTESQYLRTTDGGRTWARLRGGLPGGRMVIGAAASYGLAPSPAFGQDHTLFLAGPRGTGVWRSTDGGDHWAPCWHELGDLNVLRLAVSPDYAGDRTVLAQTESGLFRSEDAGVTWSAAGASEPLQGPPLYSPQEAFPGPPPAVQFRNVNYAELQRSDDGGQTWQTVLVGRAQQALVAVLHSPGAASDGQVYALFSRALYRSADGGLTWQVASAAAVAPARVYGQFTALALGSERDGSLRLALGEQDGRLSILDPRAIAWEPVSN